MKALSFYCFLFVSIIISIPANVCHCQSKRENWADEKFEESPALRHVSSLDVIELKLELPKTKYALGEVIWGKFSVTNGHKRGTLVMDPPWSGVYVSTIELVARAKTENDSHTGNRPAMGKSWTEPYEVYNLHKNRNGFGIVKCIEPILIEPGQAFTTWIPINVLQNNNTRAEFGVGMDSTWLSGFGFSKPDKYQFVVEYYSTARNWPDVSALDEKVRSESLDELKNLRLRRSDSLEIGRFPNLPQVLGPFEVEIVPLPVTESTKIQIASYEKMLTRWNEDPNIREPITDYVRGFREEDIAELLEILPGDDLNSQIADTLAYTAIRHHVSIERAEGKPAQFVPLKLEDIDLLLSRLMQDDPLRTHVILSKCIWLHEHDRQAEAIALADSIRATNPDAEVFWHLAQWGKWKEKK
jgi:hypothetical protein